MMIKQELLKKIQDELEFINDAYLNETNSNKNPRVILARDRIVSYQALATAMLLPDPKYLFSPDGVLCDKPKYNNGDVFDDDTQ